MVVKIKACEKTFRDHSSGFDYYPINCRTTRTCLEHREIKINENELPW